MQESIERDLKTALLAGDKKKTETLRGLKNSLQYKAVSLRLKTEDLTQEHIQQVLASESKKRQEASELYQKAGESARAEAEQAEKAIIDAYLPAQLPEAEIEKAVTDEISKMGSPGPQDMGRVIGAVRNRLGAQADGATVARLVKQGLEKQ